MRLLSDYGPIVHEGLSRLSTVIERSSWRGVATRRGTPDTLPFLGSVQESEQVVDWRGFANGEDFRTL
jgi:hypothetical protein